MSIQTITIGKRRFVLLPEKDFARIQRENKALHQRTAEDAADAAIIRRKMSDRSDRARPYDDVRTELGL